MTVQLQKYFQKWLKLGGDFPSGSFSLRFSPGLETLESAEALGVKAGGLQHWGGGGGGWCWRRWRGGRGGGCRGQHVGWRGGRRVRTVQAGHLHGEEILGRGLSLLLPLLGGLAPETTTIIRASSDWSVLQIISLNSLSQVFCALTRVHSLGCSAERKNLL